MAKNKKIAKDNQPQHVERGSLPKSSDQKLIWLSIAGLVIITFAAFSGGFNNEFVEWDDQIYIKDNYLVNQPSMAHFFKSFRTAVALNYHPLTIISLMLNAAISGYEKARPFIITNTLIHAINTSLVFILVYRLFDKKYWIAIIAALLFAVHPMRVESVIWASERKDVLYVFFFLLSLLSYIQYKNNQKTSSLVICLITFLLSCLSKGQAVVLPLALLLIDYWKGDLSVKSITSKWHFFAISLLFGLIAMNIQAGGNFHGLTQTVGEQKTALNLKIFSTTDRLVYAGYGFMIYVWKLIFPVGLSPFYPYLDFNTPEGTRYYFGLPFLFIVAGLIFLSLRKTKIVAFGWGIYLIGVILVLQFISVGAAIIADRYTYLAYLGLFILIAYGINHLIENNTILKYPVLGVSGLLITGCFYLTTQQVKVWENTGSLFGRMIEVYPNDFRAYGVHGRYIGMKGDLDGGIRDLEKCIALGTKEASTFHNLGVAYGMKGQHDKAIQMFTKAIDLGANDADPYLNRGIALFSTNQTMALQDFGKALQIAPQRALEILPNMGALQLNMGATKDALGTFNDAIGLGTTDANVYKNRGLIYLQTGNKAEAIADFQKALQLNPNLTELHQYIPK